MQRPWDRKEHGAFKEGKGCLYWPVCGKKERALDRMAGRNWVVQD